MKILLTLMCLHSACAFLITKAEPGLVLVSPGSTVTLLCAVDDDYEWCKFYHPSREFCDFEWKRSENNITMQECNLFDRVSFHGKYDDRQCGITFTATEGDTGIWKCEIEEYVTWMSRGAGRVATAQMNVTVHAPTTPVTDGTTLPTVETMGSIEPTKAVTTTKSTTIEFSSESTVDEKTLSETPEAVPQVDENQNNKAGGSSSALTGVFLVIIVIVVAVSGAVFYRKRRNSSTATAVYDRESKTNHDQTNMVRNSNSNITFHSNNAESSNLHEYYPPNLTYSTVTPESQA